MRRIFLSSTCYDLNDLRSVVPPLLEQLGLEPLLNERADFPVAQGIHSHDACIRAVEQCELFVLVIDGRYGGLYQSEDISITHKEYRVAKNNAKPMIVFVRARVFDERKHFRANNGHMKLSFADSPRVFELIDEVTRSVRDNWIIQFADAEELLRKLETKLKVFLEDPGQKIRCQEALKTAWLGGRTLTDRGQRLRDAFLAFAQCGFAQDRALGLFCVSQYHRSYYLGSAPNRNILRLKLVNMSDESIDRDSFLIKGIEPLPYEELIVSAKDTTRGLVLKLQALAGTDRTRTMEFCFPALEPGASASLEIEYQWPGPGPDKPQHYHFIGVDCFCRRAGIESVFPRGYAADDVLVYRGHEPAMEPQAFASRTTNLDSSRLLRVWVDWPRIDDFLEYRYILKMS